MKNSVLKSTYTSSVMFHIASKLPVIKPCKTSGWNTSIPHAVKKSPQLVSTVSVSAPYQLSASHGSVVIMSCSEDMFKRNGRNVCWNAQHLGKPFAFTFPDTFLCLLTFATSMQLALLHQGSHLGHSHFLVLTLVQYAFLSTTYI